MKKFFVVALIAVALALASVATACKDDDDDSGDLGEPDIKTFTDQVMFVDNGTNYLADIIDARTACGKQNLQQLGIVEKLKGAITNAINSGVINPARFTNVFSVVNGGVTIYVDNPATPYKVKAPNGNTIYFHIDYLSTVSDADLQTDINAAITAMNPANPDLPYNAE